MKGGEGTEIGALWRDEGGVGGGETAKGEEALGMGESHGAPK